MDSKLFFRLSLLMLVSATALASDKKCQMASDVGTGDKKVLRFYYDEKTGTCSPFFYNGNGGNENNFQTDAECMKNCSPNYSDYYPDGDAVCSLPEERGSCFAMILMYYYDSTEKTCRTFLYSGCQGNGNRFESRDDCQNMCHSKARLVVGDINGSNPDEQTTDVGLIVGILGGIVFAVAVVCAAVLLVQRKKQRGNRKQVPTNEGTELNEVSH